jgi:membrane protein
MKIPASLSPELMELCKRSIRGFLEHDMPTYSAALAYRALFALFPFFAFLVSLLGLLDIGGFFEWLIDQAHSALQTQYANQAEQLIRQSLYQAQGGKLLSSVIIIAIWSVSGGVRSLTKALNAIHGVGESRPGWKRVVLQAFFALGLAVTIIIATALLLIGPQLVEWIVGLVGLDEVFVALWSWLRLPVALVLIMLAVSVIYWVVPNVDHPYRLITPGAALAVIVWVIASLGFAYYVSNFANYSVVYGSLGAAVALLLYFYISAAVLLLGAEVNAAIHHRASDRNIQKEARRTNHETSSAEDSGTKDV